MTPDGYGWSFNALDQTFRKTLPPGLADVEQRGWERVRDLLPVPNLIRRIDHGASSATLVYEDVFASGRCRFLLADAITAADSDPAQTPVVAALINGICDTWMSLTARTGRAAPLSDCVTALYGHRLRPGGRLDTWYGATPAKTVVTQHGTYEMRLPLILDQLRADLADDSLWPTAITEGDPTEPNIADPLLWLDFEHAGRNTLAGEVAILLWYLLGMGGWLVPAYEPVKYARTLRCRGAGSVPPNITHLAVREHTEIEFSYRARPGRQTAIDALTDRIHSDLGQVLTPAGMCPERALKPWLAVRILGVIPLTGMSRADRAVCLATLAHVLDPGLGVRDITITTSPDLIKAA